MSTREKRMRSALEPLGESRAGLVPYSATSTMLRSAAFSRNRRYRYALRRVWDPSRASILFIGLNPSTADHLVDDPTIHRCIRFAADWGFGQLLVGNLFAFRTPSPRLLRAAADPVGPRNDSWLRRLSREAELVVAAWGNDGCFLGRDREVLARVGPARCLGMTRRGQPKHPLYLPVSTPLRDLAEELFLRP